MKAARFYELGAPLKIEQIPDPVLKPGGAIIKVLSSHVISFTGQVLSGELGYKLPEPYPYTPGNGAIGVVEAVADGVFGLDIGQMVFCDPFISSRTIGASPDGILIAWTGLAPASDRMQSLWKDGTFAEKAVLPAECLTPLGDAQSFDLAQLTYLNYLTVAYGALLRGELRPSQTLIVSGATGNLGAAAVLVALAIGVSKVVAVGRDRDTLEKLRQLDPKRIVCASLSGDAEEDSDRINTAARGADIVLDALGGVKTPETTIACINALRPRGTAVFVGGVQADIPLPYPKVMLEELTIRGAFMYPRQAPSVLLRMITAGTLNLNAVETYVFPLDDVNDAISKAPTFKGLACCTLVP